MAGQESQSWETEVEGGLAVLADMLVVEAL